MEITSTKNPQIKRIKQLLLKSRQRIKESCFIVEGVREIEKALQHNFKFEHIYISERIYKADLSFPTSTIINKVSQEVYDHIAYRSTTEGIIGVCKTPNKTIDSLNFKDRTPLIIVLESTEKPGNIGAILRTADATQVDAVIISNPKTDLYNPNTIRSSLGTVFTNTLIDGANQEVYNFLNKHNFNMFSATLQNSNSYLEEKYTEATALILGSEAKGLSEFWRNKPKIKAINIPMLGVVDSLNLSVSTAVLTYEAVRQRNLND